MQSVCFICCNYQYTVLAHVLLSNVNFCGTLLLCLYYPYIPVVMSRIKFIDVIDAPIIPGIAAIVVLLDSDVSDTRRSLLVSHRREGCAVDVVNAMSRNDEGRVQLRLRAQHCCLSRTNGIQCTLIVKFSSIQVVAVRTRIQKNIEGCIRYLHGSRRKETLQKNSVVLRSTV